jgi:uncharacterized phage protein (TIGR02218 family)
MKSASPELIASISAEATTLCRLWRVTRRDGTVFRFTDAVRNVTFGGNVYRADVSFTSSAIFTTTVVANLQSVTLAIIMDDTAFAEGDLRKRLYDSAIAQISVCDYTHPEYGELLLFSGKFGIVQLSNIQTASITIIPDSGAATGKVIGNECFQQTCRANLGDVRCTVNIDPLKVAFTVISATGGSFVAAALNQPSAHWTLGKIKWLTGHNAGTDSLISSGDQASTSIFLAAPPFYPIAPGDTGYAYPGCDKQAITCSSKFNNILNMRAEPFIPDGTPSATGLR